jgi:hypothetical protein
MLDISTRLLNCARDGRSGEIKLEYIKCVATGTTPNGPARSLAKEEGVSGIQFGASLFARYFRIERH